MFETLAHDQRAVLRLASGRTAKPSAAVQEATGEAVELIYVDQGYTGDKPASRTPARHRTLRHQARRASEGLRSAA